MASSQQRLRVGLNLTVQYGRDEDPLQVLDAHLQIVAAARDCGWHSVFLSQHYLGGTTAHLQPLPLLGLLARETGNMRLGVGICLLALHNPVDVAESFATADILARGRLIFGVGLGYRDPEYAAFGVAAAGRVERFTRNLELLTRLWAGETVTAELPWCRLREAALAVLPLQRPRPPVWLAASGDQAVRRVATLGDYSWLIGPHAPVSTIERQLWVFHAARREAGLPEPASIPLMREVICVPDRARAIVAARPLMAKYAGYRRWGQDGVLPEDARFTDGLRALAHDRFAVGEPQDCLRVIRDWRQRTGATDLILRVHWAGAPVEQALESIALLTREVLPYL